MAAIEAIEVSAGIGPGDAARTRLVVYPLGIVLATAVVALIVLPETKNRSID
jgi:hypothetical protein